MLTAKWGSFRRDLNVFITKLSLIFHRLTTIISLIQDSILQIWINFNPRMDEQSHPSQNVGWNCLSIPRLQWCNHWILGMGKYSRATFYWTCDYLSKLGPLVSCNSPSNRYDGVIIQNIYITSHWFLVRRTKIRSWETLFVFYFRMEFIPWRRLVERSLLVTMCQRFRTVRGQEEQYGQEGNKANVFQIVNHLRIWGMWYVHDYQLIICFWTCLQSGVAMLLQISIC